MKYLHLLDQKEQTQKLSVYNLEGPSYSKSLQVDFAFEPADGWELKYAYKWNKTKTTYFTDPSVS